MSSFASIKPADVGAVGAVRLPDPFAAFAGAFEWAGVALDATGLGLGAMSRTPPNAFDGFSSSAARFDCRRCSSTLAKSSSAA
ncbi:MAG: hypothetical protein ACHREM_15780 [Polyangiales bacterium]